MMKIISIKHFILNILAASLTLIPVLFSTTNVKAQQDEITWDKPVNLSNSETTSSDPFLLSDPAGYVHLFWAEKLGMGQGNQPDTIMYANWDGYSWTQPIDIFFTLDTEGAPLADYPRAVLDESGRIHLIWMTEPNPPDHTLKYSSTNAWNAGSADQWQTPKELASDLTGSFFSIDIGFQPDQGLHIIYARGNGAVKAVSYMRSMDGGQTWSVPVDIYNIYDSERGASDVRLLLEPPDRLYASWTEWDITGNGQVIYFSRSLDNGITWERPIPLAIRRGGEYERDLNNMALIGENQLVSIWEGGWRAYRGAMYSYDGGATWSDPIDIFPWLIGDNGPVEFAYDSLDRLHVFLSNRIREGNLERGTRSGLWHSVWLGGTRWREPTVATFKEGIDRMVNPKVAIVNGNKIVAAWYGSFVYELYAVSGVIKDAPEIPSIPWPLKNESVVQREPTPTIQNAAVETEEISAPNPLPSNFIDNSQPTLNTYSVIVISIVTSFVIIIIAAYFMRNRSHN